MSDNSNDSDWWVKPLSKAIAGLIIFFVIWFVEFIVNPFGNTSFTLPGGHIGLIQGVYCDDIRQPWRFEATNQTGRSNKKNWIIVNAWIDNDGTRTRESQGTLTERYEFALIKCENELTNVATIWSINTSSYEIFFRVHSGYSMQDLSLPDPSLHGSLLHTSRLVDSLLMALIVTLSLGGPFLLGTILYDILDKFIDRHVLTKVNIPIVGHAFVAIVLGGLTFIVWPTIANWLINLDVFWVENWYSQYLPKLSWSIWASTTLILGYLAEICVLKLFKKTRQV